MFAIDYAKKNADKTEKVCESFNKKNSQETQTIIKTLKALPNRRLPDITPPTPATQTEEYYDDDDDDDDDYFEEILGTMLGGYSSSIRAAEAPESTHNQELMRAIDPFAMQTVRLPPMPQIGPPQEAPPMEEDAATIPVICQIRSQSTDAQADSGANRAITDNLEILHNTRQMAKPYPVGSIDSANKLYCTAIGELRLCTKEGKIENFPCLYSAQSAGTVISPDNKCTTLPHLTQWEQVGDTITGTGAIRFRNKYEELVATLPTYRRNGLWYTQLTAIPAEDTATIRSLYATTDSMVMALTDLDRHYMTPMNMGGQSAPAVHTTVTTMPSPPEVETVDDDDTVADEDTFEAEMNDNVEELFPDTSLLKQAQERQNRGGTPYADPLIQPPKEPPPRHKKQSTRKQLDPTAPHVDDGTTTKQRPTKMTCREWQGQTPPVPKQPTTMLEMLLC
jgi:hypothetical protein